MTLIDNFIPIKVFIDQVLSEKRNSNLFFFVQIIQRSKEVTDLDSNNKVISSFYIRDAKHLEIKRQEIITLCQAFNARAYIHLTPRHWQTICAKSLVHNAEILVNNQFEGIKTSLNSIIGKYPASPRTWVLDLDFKAKRNLNAIRNIVNDYRSGFSQNVILELETKNGWHFITHPFDMRTLVADCEKRGVPSFEVHKNNPTLLYISNDN